MKSAQLRQTFLDYFHERGHTIVPSSSLVPAQDPTLLFTNAGMVQFKEVFLGLEQRPYHRAASAQRCVRAGGKHNDLENVGYTARHHTFFEMLGNFSFGDYFKREAITYAWEFLTQSLQLPVERLWVTVYEQDDEAADIWLQDIKVDAARLVRSGAEDNFWSMGDTGPCGPCTEIFYDHGPALVGGPPGSPDADGDRYVEIWNLVFMQYDRSADGALTPLPKPSVDTGMGLERLAAVMQGVHSNYDIDLFQGLIKAAAQLTECRDAHHNSLKVIADHIRSSAFLVVDGVVPANEGRGYVLRRIIRRAIRHGYELGVKGSFFHQLVGPLCQLMGQAYPELEGAKSQVERVLQQEEQRFAETLGQGMKILEQAMASLEGQVIPGETVFKLYDTYGFPVDLTADIAASRTLSIDMDGFQKEMAAQRERGRSASQFEVAYPSRIDVAGKTEFSGYEGMVTESSILALFVDGEPVESMEAGQRGMVILDRTPFYAESGGQVGDRGLIEAGEAEFEVVDTQRHGPDIHAHVGELRSGSLRVGDRVEARVNGRLRWATALNHTATHLLHAALRELLGEHITQKGSLVEPERLRFDFSHHEPLNSAQLEAVEGLVNEQIRLNNPVETQLMPYDQAVASGAMALFGEKYGDQVRVLSVGDFSTELCGGTHVRRGGDIGLFKIVSESGIAAGVRRIEAVSGELALQWVKDNEQRLVQLSGLVKGDRDSVQSKVQQLLERNRQLEKELEQLKGQMAHRQGGELATQAQDVGGVNVLAARLDGADPKTLRATVDQLKNKLGSAAVVLATVTGDKVSLVAGVTADRTKQIHAGELVNLVAQQVGGKGGGRADMAQAGGNHPGALDQALKSVPGWVREQLASSAA